MRKQRLIASPLTGEEWPILNNAVAVGSLAPATKNGWAAPSQQGDQAYQAFQACQAMQCRR